MLALALVGFITHVSVGFFATDPSAWGSAVIYRTMSEFQPQADRLFAKKWLVSMGPFEYQKQITI